MPEGAKGRDVPQLEVLLAALNAVSVHLPPVFDTGPPVSPSSLSLLYPQASGYRRVKGGVHVRERGARALSRSDRFVGWTNEETASDRTEGGTLL